MNTNTFRSRAAAALRLLLLCLLAAAVLLSPQAAAQGFAGGVRLCLSSLLPALFPFFVICRMLADIAVPARLLRPLARACGLQSVRAAAVLPIAWFGGYAVCAQLTADLRREGKISARDAAMLTALGCCSGPGFVIGSVGGLLLGSIRLGALLYILQLIANFMSALLCRPLLPCAESTDASFLPASPRVLLPEAISDAVTSCLSVCGCVVFFRLVAAVVLSLCASDAQTPLLAPFLSAASEISAGCAEFSSLGGGPALYGCALCLSVLGISVWAQLSLLLRGTVPMRFLLVSRMLHTAILQVLLRVCVRLLPGTAAAYSSLSTRTIPMQRLPPDAFCMGCVFLCAALYKLQKSIYNTTE